MRGLNSNFDAIMSKASAVVQSSPSLEFLAAGTVVLVSLYVVGRGCILAYDAYTRYNSEPTTEDISLSEDLQNGEGNIVELDCSDLEVNVSTHVGDCESDKDDKIYNVWANSYADDVVGTSAESDYLLPEELGNNWGMSKADQILNIWKHRSKNEGTLLEWKIQYWPIEHHDSIDPLRDCYDRSDVRGNDSDIVKDFIAKGQEEFYPLDTSTDICEVDDFYLIKQSWVKDIADLPDDVLENFEYDWGTLKERLARAISCRERLDRLKYEDPAVYQTLRFYWVDRENHETLKHFMNEYMDWVTDSAPNSPSSTITDTTITNDMVLSEEEINRIFGDLDDNVATSSAASEDTATVVDSTAPTTSTSVADSTINLDAAPSVSSNSIEASAMDAAPSVSSNSIEASGMGADSLPSVNPESVSPEAVSALETFISYFL